MTTSETRTRALLREGRALQRYVFGDDAPRLALRRYVRLLGSAARPLPIARRAWSLRWFPALLEPLPFITPSATPREAARRLHLVMTVTELTPWGGARDRALAARGIAAALLRVSLFAAVEAFALPMRVAAHAVLRRSRAVPRGR